MIHEKAAEQGSRQHHGAGQPASPQRGAVRPTEQGSPLARTLERRAHLDDNDEEIWNQRERAPNRNGLGRTGDR
jgi:hypothetical protein